MNKTITLGYQDNPIVSICMGHVTATEFNAAFKAEGWSSDWIRKETLKYEYRKKLKRSWKRVDKNTKGAIKVTASYW
jgi:hypothetical protein